MTPFDPFDNGPPHALRCLFIGSQGCRFFVPESTMVSRRRPSRVGRRSFDTCRMAVSGVAGSRDVSTTRKRLTRLVALPVGLALAATGPSPATAATAATSSMTAR